MKYWFLCLFLVSHNTFAQNLSSYDRAFERSSWNGLLDYFRESGKNPLTVQEIATAPVEMGVAIASIPLARKYLNSKMMSVWEEVIPVEVQSFKGATSTLKTYDKTVFNKIAKTIKSC